MTREELLAKAKAKQEREALLERARAKMNGTPTNDQTVEEMPSNLKWSDRAIAKNFANSPEAQVKYIQQQYPDQQVTLKDGNVYMRANSTEPWKAMDPKGLDWQDVTDLGYDIPASVIQSGATALSAIGGGLATGGAGTLPAAVVASGATGAGLEYLRQKLGQMYGVPQEVDSGQVGLAGGVGAVSPLLFGAGNITKGMMPEKILANKSPEAVKALVNQQRGLFGRAADALAPKLSSVPPEAIKAYSKHGQQSIDEIIEGGGLINYLDDVSNQANSAIQKQRSAIGQEMSAAYKNAGKPLPLDEVKKPFLDAINELEQVKQLNPEAWTPALEKRLQSIKNGFNEIMPKADSVDAERAFDLQGSLKRLNNNFELRADQNNYDYLNAVNSSYSNLNKGLDQATDNISSKLKGQYKDILALDEMAGNDFSNGQKLYNTLSNMDKGTKLQFKEQVVPKVKDLGVDLQNPYEKVQSFKYFAEPKLLPISNGSTSTTYTNTLGKLGSDAGAIMANTINPSYTSTKAGGAAGGLLGSFAASPKVTKAIIDYNKKQIAPFYLNQNVYGQPFLEYMYEQTAGKP